MADIKWSDEQQKVIDVRNRNVLVSAAAGSGKTAVLVERIIQMISDKNKPLDVDRLLVVTFTQAAAAEMRERIMSGIEKKLLEDPDNFNLRRQLVLIDNAKISTIDSFCQSVVRDHFDETGLEPSFRAADSKELAIIRKKVVVEVLDDAYKTGTDRFFDLVEEYTDGRDDKKLEELILKLHDYSMSHPWPDEWLSRCGKFYEDDNNVISGEWFSFIMKYIYAQIDEVIRNLKTAFELASSSVGPYKYMDLIKDEIERFAQIRELRGYEEIFSALDDYKFERLPSIKSEECDLTIKETCTASRDKAKSIVKKLINEFGDFTLSEMEEFIVKSSESALTLINLARKFSKKYSEEKLKRNIVDFSDMEHYALNILAKKDNIGNVVPTDIAKEMSEYFEEIIVDEYQDSNYVQETILKAVSREAKGENNIFMVGDVKQSIYGFRMAKPSLFIEKFNKYSTDEDAQNRLICLNKNFRSDEKIVEYVNGVFDDIMIPELGGIDYRSGNQLVYGANYKEENDWESETTLAFILSHPKEERKYEANYIAEEIERLVSEKTKVYDKKTGEIRDIQYGDIAVLYRGLSTNKKFILEALEGRHIPNMCAADGLLYETLEVKLLLNFLKLVDNPYQDIPLVSVLSSIAYNLSANDIALIKVDSKKLGKEDSSKFKLGLNEFIFDYTERIEDEKIKDTVYNLKEKLEKYRRFEITNSVSKLVHYICEDSDLFNMVLALPNGRVRYKNMLILEEMARDFEAVNDTGLFGFLQFFDRLIKEKEDIKEAKITSGEDNAVKVMTIHASKGLEFPVVFLGGMGNKFSSRDFTDKILLHDDFGIGVDYMDVENRMKTKTLIKRAISKKMMEEQKAEELRLLYVAMTRAKERLYLIYSSENVDNVSENYKATGNLLKEGCSYSFLMSANCYMDWVAPVVYKKHDNELFHVYIEDSFPSENVENIARDLALDEINKQKLFNLETDENAGDFKTKIEYEYPYQNDQGLMTKMSVSEIKKQHYHFEDEEAYIPEFVRHLEEETAEDEGISEITADENKKETVKVLGTERGSAYHRVFELLELDKLETKEDVEKDIERMVTNHLISSEWVSLVKLEKVCDFVFSDIGKRMAMAKKENRLFREKPYVMGVPANEVEERFSKDEIVLVQGIIDAYFEENGAIVIVDYKTDKVDSMDVLKDRYKVQLDYYEKAISQVTGMKVSKKIIYSVFKNEILEV